MDKSVDNRKRYIRQISIRELSPPSEENPNAGLDWLFQCLGLGDENDELAKEIFKELVKASREKQGVSSRELKEKENVTQAAVIYHLNIFMRSGIVIKEGRTYYLRADDLERTLQEIEEDMQRRFERMKRIAKKIEEALNEEEE
ncbi:winged helix-turn-helix transcriptional regulator [Candidatus Micrarchaeota archaeon]|nr:winged helix-turn-helix transcriptional regulator [Candidatus Micrarchaeota archaeon]